MLVLIMVGFLLGDQASCKRTSLMIFFFEVKHKYDDNLSAKTVAQIKEGEIASRRN